MILKHTAESLPAVPYFLLVSAGFQSELLVFALGLKVLLSKHSSVELLRSGERFRGSFTVLKDFPTNLCTPDHAGTLDRLILWLPDLFAK